jgi:hypothetical protein
MIVVETTRSTQLVNSKPKHNNYNNSPRKKTNTQHPPSTTNQKQN